MKAVRDHMAPDGVINGAGGGDGGLFGGILARYLALVGDHAARRRRPPTPRHGRPRKDLVLKSAQSAWDNRQTVDGLPLFAAFWDRAADIPDGGRRRTRSSSRVRSTPPRSPSGTCRCSCRAGC